MSELIQSGQHPDADQLSAFLEDALAPHEREQTLAHLAVCTDCRTIVGLSLPPLDESPTTQPEPARRPWLWRWFGGWNLAWPAVAALAGLAFFLIHLHNAASSKGSTTTPAQIATAHPPPPLPVQNVPPVSVSTSASPSPVAKALPRSGASATSAASLAKPKIPGTVIDRQSIGDGLVEGRNTSTLPQAQAAGGAGMASGKMALHGAAVGRPQTPPTNLANSAQTNMFSAGRAAAAAPSLAPPPAPAPTMAEAPPPPAPQAALDGLSDDANANASATALSDSGVAPVAATPAATPGFTLRATSNMALPSHLPALSSAANGHQILAIDTQNTLFYSEDDGQHWATVPAHWRGRAVRVNLARPGGVPAAATGSLTTSSFGATGGPITAAAGTALAGTVTDPSGAIISGASVTINDGTTKTARTVQSDRNGRYLADNLTPGSYQIEATAPGFSKLQQTAVTVAAGQQNQANLTLSVGSESETVTVEAAEAMPMAAPAAAPRAALKKAVPAVPAAAVKPVVPVFEITTDNGDRWTSADGKTWTQK